MSEIAVLSVRQSELLFIRIGTAPVTGRFDSKPLLVQCEQTATDATTTFMTTTTTPASTTTTTPTTTTTSTTTTTTTTTAKLTTSTATSDDTPTATTSDTTTSALDEIVSPSGLDPPYVVLIVAATLVCCFAVVGVAVWRFRSSNNEHESNNASDTRTADTELDTTPSTASNAYEELELKPIPDDDDSDDDDDDDDGYEACPVDRDPIDDEAGVFRKTSSRGKTQRSKTKTKKIKKKKTKNTQDDANVHHYSDFDSGTRTTNYNDVFITDEDLKRQSAIAMAPLSSSYSDSESDCKSFMCCVVKLDFNFSCIAGNVNDGYGIEFFVTTSLRRSK
jgi:hypothetical protein